jgi:kynurenine formamidase
MKEVCEMFVFLSYKLDPKDGAWPGEATLKVEQDSQIGKDGKPFNSIIAHLPNHFGTHFDAPLHFNPKGIPMHELPIDYFAYKGEHVLLADVPKAPKEVVTKEDIRPYEKELKNAKLLLIRTGFEKYKYSQPKIYENEGPCLHPDLSRYLVENFENLLCVGMDFLSIGSPCNDLGKDGHQWLLGYHTKKFVTAIEDMPLSPLGNKKIKTVTLGPLRIVGADSAQVSVIAEIED